MPEIWFQDKSRTQSLCPTMAYDWSLEDVYNSEDDPFHKKGTYVRFQNNMGNWVLANIVPKPKGVRNVSEDLTVDVSYTHPQSGQLKVENNIKVRGGRLTPTTQVWD